MITISINWPEWAYHLVFDRDGQSEFFADEPDGCQFGIWQTEGRHEEAEQNTDYTIPTWERFPIGYYFSKEATP